MELTVEQGLNDAGAGKVSYTGADGQVGGSLKIGPRHIASLLLVLLIGGGVALAAADWGWHWWTVGRFFVATDDSYLQSDMVPISTEVTGRITEVDVDDNRAVHQGDVLLRIDDRDYQAQLAQATADVESDQAALANLAARTALQQATIVGAQSQVAAANADAQFASRERARFEQLNRSGVSSAERAEQAEADETRQIAMLRVQDAALTAAQQQLLVLNTEKDQILASLQRHRAVLAEANTALERTVIRAPSDGIVGARGARVGAFVQPGQQLLVVVPVKDLYVTANFKETQLRRIALGMPANLYFDTFPGVEFHGIVDSLAPASGAEFSILPPENATGNFTKIIQRFPVKIRMTMDNPLTAQLRPGMSVTASVDTRGADSETR